MIEPFDHAECQQFLKEKFAELGCEVTISTVPPLIKTAYDQEPFICPHGTAFYPAPTSEQIMQWAKDGVR